MLREICFLNRAKVTVDAAHCCVGELPGYTDQSRLARALYFMVDSVLYQVKTGIVKVCDSHIL